MKISATLSPFVSNTSSCCWRPLRNDIVWPTITSIFLKIFCMFFFFRIGGIAELSGRRNIWSMLEVGKRKKNNKKKVRVGGITFIAKFKVLQYSCSALKKFARISGLFSNCWGFCVILLAIWFNVSSHRSNDETSVFAAGGCFAGANLLLFPVLGCILVSSKIISGSTV